MVVQNYTCAVRLLVRMRSSRQSYGGKICMLPHKTNFMGAIAPTAPIVRTPIDVAHPLLLEAGEAFLFHACLV